MSHLPLSTTSVRTDNDAVFHIQVLPDPLQHARLGIKVVDRHIEETLNLTSVKVHSDDMVAASGLEHVGHQLGGNRSTTLVLLILARIREVGDDSRDASGRGRLASIYHDKKLHETIVDVVGFCGLQNEN